QAPSAEAGAKGTYTGIPVQLGNISSGPGTYSWSPATGLNDPAISQPLASPMATTTYTLTVNNNGCIATDTVTVAFGGIGHTISGKTLYAGKANAGNPVPNTPTYNPVLYSINHEIVILKSYPANDELARDTSDANGYYQFTNVMDGNYILSYDKYIADTMIWANDVNAIDVALIKYLVGSDTLQDPTRCFSSKYKKAANVDNNLSINAVDIARIKAKIGAPYDPIRNFPRGNWVAMDKPLAVAGADVSINLETISYGDYNASSSKYRDSLNTWSGAKSLPEEFIFTSDETIIISKPSYFEVPLKVNTKVKDFSALGLEISYPNSEYKLVSAYMPGTKDKSPVKINPSLEEIITQNNDLLVTDEHGTIRVVYATTNHFDVAPNNEILVLGFRPLKGLEPGEVDFALSGTGVIGNQFGEENDDTYLIKPRIFVQGNNEDAGFEFSGYPNPFSGEATLTYNIPERGTVTLNVYNAIGELVTELVNENQESGKHSVVFSQKDLASGMYTFKLEFTGLGQSKNLILKLIH
ncbi:MAG TPA: T9SS type A sorting domain-containing protein, partial [Bacteroidales bacterium]|nr:T9SS type A sorting domain-containing protein [Bacteroidales bacterium]